MTGLLTAWLTEIILVTYRETKQGVVKGYPLPIPLPSEYVATFVVFGSLGVLAQVNPTIPAMVGWGFVLATLLNLWDPTQPPGTVKNAVAANK